MNLKKIEFTILPLPVLPLLITLEINKRDWSHYNNRKKNSLDITEKQPRKYNSSNKTVSEKHQNKDLLTFFSEFYYYNYEFL